LGPALKLGSDEIRDFRGVYDPRTEIDRTVIRLQPCGSLGILPAMNELTRRHFLQGAAAVAALTQFPSLLRGATSDRKLQLGVIGCGGYGMTNIRAALKAGGAEIAAICDVDSAHLNKTAEATEKLQGKSPRSFKLHEDLLAMTGLDAVIIATPPQWHALQLIASVQRGLDVYCEKPLCYDIREGRAMIDAVRKTGRIVQIGFQRRQNPSFKAVQQHLQAGNAGRIVSAEANIHYTAGRQDPNPQNPPASLDWELWCGPAPKIPYSPQVGHVHWRLEKTTGHGHLVDWGIHLIDGARLMLGQGAPQAVSAAGGIYYLHENITTPDVLTSHFEFASCPLTWRHRIWGAEEYTPAVSNGIFFYGEKETIFVTDDRWEIIPRGKGKERQTHQARADAGVLHMAEFLDAVRTRKQPSCTIEDGHHSTVAVKLAMIAYDTGSKVTWDSQTETISGHPEAAKLLKRDYRKPWQHPHKA
jgi:predicted dehydrogenase